MSVPLWLIPPLWGASIYLLIVAGWKWRQILRRERRAGRRDVFDWTAREDESA